MNLLVGQTSAKRFTVLRCSNGNESASALVNGSARQHRDAVLGNDNIDVRTGTTGWFIVLFSLLSSRYSGAASINGHTLFNHDCFLGHLESR